MTSINFSHALKIALVLFTLTGNGLFAQDTTFFLDKVQCYYESQKKEPLLIYDSINDLDADTLDYLYTPFCWYVLAISESKDGWLKIYDLTAMPGCDESNDGKLYYVLPEMWVRCENMRIGSPEAGFKLYENPDVNSKIACNVKNFVEVSLIGIHGTWARVSFEQNGKIVKGWMKREDQCASPWTSCNWSE